ncbi:MAG: hypothetical protein NTV24_05395, partial [Candidatus Woesebacteria bacterium]|nr:hypothetical protein [Candidatus Woesebacteria bacterium]
MPIDKNTDFEEVTFHPSLDIKNGILVLGFRIQTAVDKEEEIYLVTSKDSVWLTKEKSFTIDNRNYYIDLKKKKLAKLSRKWDKKQLEAFCEEMQKNWKRPNPAEVFGKLKNLLRVYMDIDDVDYTLLAIWAIGTYFFPIFSAYPYLHIKAPKGSGKTQCLSFLNQVCFNAVKARASLPALRDTIDAQRGTYLMDQADALYRINMEDLLDILTDSYKRGGGEIRKLIADKGKSWNLEEFQAYGPKGFASILPLPEDLRDRCLIISLTKSNKNLGTLDEEDAIWKEMRG